MCVQECATFIMHNHAPSLFWVSVISSEQSILTSGFADWSDHVHPSSAEPRGERGTTCGQESRWSSIKILWVDG